MLACLAFGLSTVAQSRVWLHSSGRLHVWYHLALFALLGLLAMRSSHHRQKRCLLLVACFLVGLGTEVMESMHFHTDFEWNDVATDALGTAWGGVVGWVVSRWARER